MPHRSDDNKPSGSDPSVGGVLRSFLPTRALHWVGAGLTFGAIGVAGAVAVILTGVLDLSAIAPHPEGFAKILHGTFQRSVAAHAEPVPETISLDDPALIMLGAGHFANVCATCHGAPGYGQNPVALSMRPEPPMLLEVANKYTDGELFRIVAGGARYSAMPAWPVENRPDEVWAMVAFLKALPTMDKTQYESLAHGDQIASDDAYIANDKERPPRPYLPGDPQSPFASPHATDRPATGFVNVRPADSVASACTSCHGPDGAGRSGGAFPNLTLQSPEYISESLKAFAAGDRQSGVMWTVAANLSAGDIDRLAKEFGGGEPLPSRGPATGGATDPDVIARGKEIALNGIPRSDAPEANGSDQPAAVAVQACQGCHEEVADSTPAMPQIAGQNRAYLTTQLRAFRGEGRGHSLPYNPMSMVSHRLSDADIRALAAYYASLPPEKRAAETDGSGAQRN